MNELQTINNSKTLDSIKVAEMLGKEHKQLLREIRTHIQVLTSENLSPVDFFINSSYLDNKGEERPCFSITKMGCEMLGNKLQGAKGTLFTAKYVKAFNQMEQAIQSPKELTALEQLNLQRQAILEVNDKVEALEKDMPLFKAECDELQDLVHKVGVRYLGGKKSKAYNDASLRGRVYADIQHQLKREFGVNKYAWIKHSQFNKAKEIISNYTLPIVLEDEIILANNQLEMEDM